MSKVFRLCYATTTWAWFSTLAPTEQWGDDWNDAPYEHNAGEPYQYTDHDRQQGRPEYQLERIAYHGQILTPCELSNVRNTPWSVQDINAGKVPWFTAWGTEDKLFAGATIEEFLAYVWRNGGQVFREVQQEGKA